MPSPTSCATARCVVGCWRSNSEEHVLNMACAVRMTLARPLPSHTLKLPPLLPPPLPTFDMHRRLGLCLSTTSP
jgi:hypothetical protein